MLGKGNYSVGSNGNVLFTGGSGLSSGGEAKSGFSKQQVLDAGYVYDGENDKY